MLSKSLSTIFLLTTTVLAQTRSSLPTISAVGSKFFFSNGTQYYIKGVAYQLTPDDPLIDTKQCYRDARLMASLGANTIRVYHVDPTADHDGCMQAFLESEIYLFLDLDTFNTQFDQDNPYWNQTQLSAFNAVLDAFHDYSNLAGVFVANEAMTRLNGSDTAPFIKAAIRDVKAHREEKGYRPIPVGYSGADIPSLRPMLQNYLACGPEPAQAADFFSLNVYEWCGCSSFRGSGYSDLVTNATGLQIPVFVSETGCNDPTPRLFTDQASILGPDMTDTWSGAIIYEWIAEANDYGLIRYGDKVDAADPTALDGYPRSGTPTPVSPDFSNLKKQWATLFPTGVASSDYASSASDLTPIACPTSTQDGWIVDPSAELPSLGSTLDRAAASSTAGAASASASQTGAAVAVGRGTIGHGMVLVGLVNVGLSAPGAMVALSVGGFLGMLVSL